MTKVILINLFFWGAVLLLSIKTPVNLIFISIGFVISLVITGLIFNKSEND